MAGFLFEISLLFIEFTLPVLFYKANKWIESQNCKVCKLIHDKNLLKHVLL
jgi:hypothetical protein